MNLIINFINRIETYRDARPRLFRIGLIILWCACPIEMLAIKLGVLGYKRYKNRFSQQEKEELK